MSEWNSQSIGLSVLPMAFANSNSVTAYVDGVNGIELLEMNPDTTPRASTPTEENSPADPATGEVEDRSFQIDRDGITELREINPAPVPETSTRIEENPPAEPATSELEAQFMDEDHPIPTEEENQNLRKIAATPNCISFVLYFVVLADRASYCATQAVLSNFIRFPLPKC